jgi:hypothetical protein
MFEHADAQIAIDCKGAVEPLTYIFGDRCAQDVGVNQENRNDRDRQKKLGGNY